jgi:hypothetical protein
MLPQIRAWYAPLALGPMGTVWQLRNEQAFIAVASRKGRLVGENGKDLQALERENETLRALIADALIENARLKRRVLRAR